jgi:hypothetical protein
VRSRGDRQPSPLVLALWLLLALAPAVAVAQPAASSSPTGAPTDVEIAQALEKVKADPNLATERTVRMLRWKDGAQPQQKPTDTPEWLGWIGGLFRWIDQSTRVLVWLIVIALGLLLAFYLVRLLSRFERPATIEDEAFVAPTHVRDLDIRPEALPADVGAGARVLWDRGEHRAALSLLYRGLLSRLAHVHRVPLRDSSTEGDCLALASRHLTRQTREYAARLVGVWQRAVYGREDVQAQIVHELCDGFGRALDAPSSYATIPRRGAA